jgi:hypothetical protein
LDNQFGAALNKIGARSSAINSFMPRQRRYTVRFEDAEMKSIERFATQNHVLPSVAVRWLIAVGLRQDRPRQQARLPTEEQTG